MPSDGTARPSRSSAWNIQCGGRDEECIMWGRTSRGTRTIGLAAVSVVALSLTTSGPARAVDLKNPARGARAAAAVPSVCTVTGYRPNRITLGASPVRKTFSVQVTGCTLAEWLVVVGP